MTKLEFCICKNKATDELHSICAADQRLCFRYIDSTIPLLPKSILSCLYPFSAAVQPGLCWTWLETEDRFSHNAQIKALTMLGKLQIKVICV